MPEKSLDPPTQKYLIERVGKTLLRQRIGVETEHEADAFGQGLNYFHIENTHWAHTVIRGFLRLTGMTNRGKRNCLDIEVRENVLPIVGLPASFEGYTLLQMSDLHLDLIEGFPEKVAEIVSGLDYDVAVLTGDYRYKTHGSWEPAMQGLQVVRHALKTPVYGILGNHDTIFMTEQIESLDIRLLLNENVFLQVGDDRVCLAGIDDAHYFQSDNLEKAYEGIGDEDVSILLSHTPETYRHAAYVGFDVLLAGHTHGGQICLPGGFAPTYNIAAPRHMGVGPWTYHMMQGYTSAGTGSSVVPARFNCRPEVTLHRLTVAS